jgi:diguanylate cyclase (GGDEF)-like protein
MVVEPKASTVLVVDDENLFLEFLTAIVDQEHSVLQAASGEEALDVARKSNPDLILLDIRMPGMDGYDVLRALKSDPITTDIPVIFVTASNSADDEVNGLAVGAVDYITKPLVPIVVKARVNAHLEIKNQRDFLRKLATLDGLTGIPNRRAFDDALAMEWRRSQRNKTSLSLALIDIDHFKLFNDSYGHLEGDDCLKRFSDSLRKCLHRPGDLFARYGGEEFVCLMPDTDIKGAKDVAEKMRKAVEWLDIPHDTSPVADVLTASFGLATTIAGSNQDLSNVNDLIARADLALYQAKEQGRNCIVLDGSPPI